jgi:hypothetical protein
VNKFTDKDAQDKFHRSAPSKCDQPGQKFPRGARVKVTDEMPSSMAHFQKGFEGIVEYTYAQKYNGDNVDSYSLIVLADGGKPVNSISWYKECQLTLISDDVEAGEQIIEEYKYPTA